MHKRLISPSNPHPQRGASKVLLLSVLALLVLGGGGAWWWLNRAPASADGGAGPGLSDRMAAGPSAVASAAAGAGAGRRFGGSNRIQPVSVIAARRQDVRVVLTAIGNIAALNTATVRTHVDGDLKALHFKEGQQVKAGALLAEIDPRAYEIALAQAQGQLTRDMAQQRNAQLDLDRYKDLWAKDSIAKQQVDAQESLVRQLAGTVQTDQALVDNAKLQLGYTKLSAPIGGRLGLKLVDLGNTLHATDAAGLVSITQTQPIAVVFAVPEANLRQINSKLKANQALVVEAWDREQKNKLAVGRVSSTDNAIDMGTGTIKLKALFPNLNNELFPNQFVNIRLQVDALTDTLVVPSNAVQRGPQGTFVYVVKEDSSVTIRRMRLGTTEGDWVSVQGELAVGDRVVTDGADRLREGAKVEVITSTARPAAAGVNAGTESVAGRESKGPRNGASAPSLAASARKPGASGDPSGATPSAAAPASAAPAEAGERPRWMDRLPPEMVEKVKAMGPDERRAFFQKLRERRQAE